MKYDRDELYLIKDFLEEMQEGCDYAEAQSMFELTIEIIKSLIKE